VLMQRGNVFRTLPNGRVLLALVAVFAILIAFQPVASAKGGNTKPPKAPKSSIVVFDDFKSDAGSLVDHLPKTDEIGTGWQPIRGNWEIDGGSAFDTLGYSTPYFTTINPSASNYTVSIDVQWFGGSEAGLVFRYENAQNYYSVVYSGKKIELRKTIDGITTKIDDKKLKWKRFDTNTIQVVAEGPEISVRIGKVKKKTEPTEAKLGKKVVLKTTDSDLLFSRKVGAIVQRTENDSFKKIDIRALGPQVSPPPIAIPAIDDAVLFDEFDDVPSPVALIAHSPDTGPDGALWAQGDGSAIWTVDNGIMTAKTNGQGGDLRVTIDTEIANTDIYTEMTWHNGLAGIVYRHIDESHWWMTWFDGNKFVTASWDGVEFITHDQTSFDWGTPGTTHTLRIRINDHAVRLYVDYGDIATAVILSDLLQGESRVGFFNRFGNENSFSKIVVTESPALPVPDPPPTGFPPLPDPAEKPPLPPGFVLYDSFSDIPAWWNGIHEPDLHPEFRRWSVDTGHWLADFEQLTEATGAQSDQRAIIDTGVEDSLIEVEIDWESGRAGIAFRYRDEKNWAMAWYDGFGDIVFGKIVDGKFAEMGRFKAKVKEGKKLKLTVWVEDDLATVRLDKKTLGSFDVSELSDSTFVGLFSRNVNPARFDNLAVAADEDQPNVSGLDFSPVLFDSFTEETPMSIASGAHTIDLAPVGARWVDYAGHWIISDGSVHFAHVFHSDLRTAIPSIAGDQRVSADITYNGGIVGLNFRYRHEGSWYMFWFGGRELFLAKNVEWNFTMLGRQGIDWGPAGTTRTLSIVSNGDTITAFIDGVDLFNVVGHNQLIERTSSGLFSRAVPTTTTFDNFRVDSIDE